MSLRDNRLALVRAMEKDAVANSVAMEAIAALPETARLRILAFFHFLQDPEYLTAVLDLSGGHLRLTLTARQPAEPS